MADPVSVTGLVLQLGLVIKQLYDYGKAVKSAQKDIVSLCGELSALKSVLADVESLQRPVSDNSEDDVRRMLYITNSIIQDLSSRLQLKTKMPSKAVQLLKWPFEHRDVNEILARIERLKSWFLMKMMADERATSTDLRASVDALSMLVSDGPFTRWLRTNEPDARGLLLTGPSGSGKTTLFSQAVERARDYASNDDSTQQAYFYCMYNDDDSKKLRNILGSWVVQLARRSTLVAHFRRYLAGIRKVTTAELEACLASLGGTIFLFLDAVNESSEAQELIECVRRLTAGSANIKCLMTTTPMSVQLPTFDVIVMRPQDIALDIYQYIRSEIIKYPMLQAVPETRISAALLTRADGMFRWVSCQMAALVLQRTPKRLLKALDELPGTLNDTYAAILSRISVTDRMLVRETLLWLCYAMRPLTLDELCEAIVFEESDTDIDETCRLKPQLSCLNFAAG